MLASIGSQRVELPVRAYAALISAYRQEDVAAFNHALSGYQEYLRGLLLLKLGYNIF